MAVHHFLLTFFITCGIYAQEITLFQQFNGTIDYLAIGNTLNSNENNIYNDFCETLSTSEAILNVPNTATIEAAFLYWAGSGSGDQNVTLNSTAITAENTYTTTYNYNGEELTYFSCYANITSLINTLGNTNYIFSDLDISEVLQNQPGYCNTRTNFAGWCIYVIYEDASLPINQISLFQGLEIINRVVQEKTILIDNLNVVDTQGAKIGFLAWEGDRILDYGETLSINGNTLSNEPLNPPNNAFNGTNSFTNSTTLYNVDIDVYAIENNIQIGDTIAEIKLTTGDYDENGNLQADLILLNNVITVLNSQLPDASATIHNVTTTCPNTEIEIDFNIYNTNSNANLPAGTNFTVYINNTPIYESETNQIIAVNESISYNLILPISSTNTSPIEVTIIIDEQQLIVEQNETNNTSSYLVTLENNLNVIELPPAVVCNVGYLVGTYNLIEHLELQEFSTIQPSGFYESLEHAIHLVNPIETPNNYTNISNLTTIYYRDITTNCTTIYKFNLTTKNCPPYIPEAFSPNNDGYNDWFNIQGLYDVFTNHKLEIYNRYGTLIFVGNNSKKWYGKANQNFPKSKTTVPTGTYFYVLDVKDKNYPLYVGFVYLTK